MEYCKLQYIRGSVLGGFSVFSVCFLFNKRERENRKSGNWEGELENRKVGISAFFMEKKEEQGIKEHGEDESDVNGIVEMENEEVGLAMEIDFKPIEHPPEPPDEDLPIKCPIPEPLSLIVEEVFEEPCTESLQTIAQLLEQKETD